MDELKLNTKFISFDGILGRREYLLNIAYISIIAILCNLPVTISMLTHAGTIADHFNFLKLFMNLPVFLKIWYILCTAFILYVNISNNIRRANDICGKVNVSFNTIIALIRTLVAVSSFVSFKLFCIFLPFSVIISLILYFKKGKITRNYPHHFLKEFNWGAFFGTWIWGLFNKSFKTLWMLILGLTPAGLWFAIVCGLKGNEWSYNNKKWPNDTKFRRSQETQTIVFIVLKLIILPVIYICLFLCLIGVIIAGVASLEKAPAHQKAAIAQNIVNFAEKYALLYFDSYKIEKNENKFYIEPKDWADSSFNDKKQIFNMAASLSSYKRNKANPKTHTTKAKELNRTKIYSSKTGELLGEFYMDSKIDPKNADFKTMMKAILNSYRFYNPKIK